jgi:signal transduction histidine kinase
MLEVRLGAVESDVILEVGDDGRGFDPAGSFPGHLGLHTMRERVTKFGGQLEFESEPGKGTRVRAHLRSEPGP